MPYHREIFRGIIQVFTSIKMLQRWELRASKVKIDFSGGQTSDVFSSSCLRPFEPQTQITCFLRHAVRKYLFLLSYFWLVFNCTIVCDIRDKDTQHQMQPQAGRSWFIALEESKVNGASAIFEGRQGLEGDGADSVITWPPPCRYSLHNCFEQIIAEFNQTKDTRKLMFPLSLSFFWLQV